MFCDKFGVIQARVLLVPQVLLSSLGAAHLCIGHLSSGLGGCEKQQTVAPNQGKKIQLFASTELRTQAEQEPLEITRCLCV